MTDSFMFQNRFASGIGGYGMAGRFGHNAFDMPSSAQYRQFHQMKAQMPSDVLQLFKANQVGFLKAPVKPKCRPLDPVLTMKINLMQMFQIPNLQLIEEQKPETKQQRISRIQQQKKQLNQNRIRAQLSEWNPFQQIKMNHSDPEKTLFVSRMNYQTTQKTLKFQFEKYGIIKNVYIVKDLNGQSRGYGFVQFDSKQDFITAYKQGNGRKIDGRKVIVDYQRGRTTLKWRPRRFGGGAGQSRMTKQELQKHKNQQIQKKNNPPTDSYFQNNFTKQQQRRRSQQNHSRSRSPGKKQKRRQQFDDKGDRSKRKGSSKQRRDRDNGNTRDRQRQRDKDYNKYSSRDHGRRDHNNIRRDR